VLTTLLGIAGGLLGGAGALIILFIWNAIHERRVV
jgi:hypothetical protein